MPDDSSTDIQKRIDDLKNRGIGPGIKKPKWIERGLEKLTPELADQMKIYKEAAVVKEQANVEKRKIQEKQIRALRNNYRPAGGLLRQAGNPSGAQLGDSTGLPSKLGTV